MNEELLREYRNNGFTIKKISEALGKSQTSIRYWLNKFNIITQNNAEEKRCKLCDETKPINDFYKKENRSHSFCKICYSKSICSKIKNYKLNMIAYKGGRCIRCGYDKCPAALELHHRDPSQKKFTPSLLGHRKLNYFKEIEKCDLLCAVCHRETHHEWVMNSRSSQADNDSNVEPTKVCSKCNNALPRSMFYRFSGSPNGMSWECKSCNYQRKTIHRNKIKELLISSVNKKIECEVCSYNSCISAIEIHHIFSKEKKINMSDIQSINISNEQFEEMKSCQILCVNCHRETHWNVLSMVP